MPFGLGFGEATVVIAFVLAMWALPLGLAIWALVTLARIRSGQQEILTRLKSIEHHVGAR
jgi:type IV secretory pathway TrbD component